MKKLVLIFTLAFATYDMASGQVFYFELGGPGIASFNLDTRFSSGPGGLGARVGVGGYSVDGTGQVYLPIGINYLIGEDTKHFFEVGAGVTPVFGDDFEDGIFTQTFGHILFGYRLQPADGGFSFRAFLSPIFSSGYFIPYYGGVSFGYKF